MTKFKTILCFAFLCLLPAAYAQTSLGTLNWNGLTIPAIINTPITVQGQTLIIETNASGSYTVTTYGPQGTNSFTPPTSLTGVEAFLENAVQNNKPSNIGFYSTNGEYVLSLGGAFAQNSGQGAVQLSIEKYGLVPSLPNFSLGAAVLEGNQNGLNGTAAAYAFVDYRHPIGDVAFVMGLGGGYDNYTGRPMGILKIEVEYRSGPHLGEFVGVAYDFEGFGTLKAAGGATVSNPSGIVIGGGIHYAFGKIL